MRSPADMQIIQIELTDACESRCSACTRLVPHVQKPFFLELPAFERAVRSMEGWKGLTLGAMGGNPVLHPEFAAITHSFVAHWGRPVAKPLGREPIADFPAFVHERLYDHSSGRGLWSSLGHKFYHHFELICDSYSYWCCNDHHNAGLHQGLLIGRKEFCEQNGLSDDKWLQNRDRCWVQMTWSASVNHHGAYFCEVAAAIDNLFFDGASAWPVESGWWKRKPSDFNDQLHLCDHCALAQPGPSVTANLDRDIVGRQSLPMLQKCGSPAVRKNAIDLYDAEKQPHQDRPFRPDWYMPEPYQRVAKDNPTVHARKVSAVVVCVGRAAHLERTLAHNARLVDELIVVTTPEDGDTRDRVREHIEAAGGEPKCNVSIVLSDECFANDYAFNKGAMLNAGLAEITNPDWIVFTDADIYLNENLPAFAKDYVLNPGVLYGTLRYEGTKGEIDAVGEYGQFLGSPSVVDVIKHLPHNGNVVNSEPNGYFQLWNVRAQAVRGNRPVVSEAFCSAGGVDTWFAQQWAPDKRLVAPHLAVVHIAHGDFGAGWNGEHKSEPRWVQVGMLDHLGYRRLIGPLPEKVELLLTETHNGNQARVEHDPVFGTAIPENVLRLAPDGTMIFCGKNIGRRHVHVAAYLSMTVLAPLEEVSR